MDHSGSFQMLSLNSRGKKMTPLRKSEDLRPASFLLLFMSHMHIQKGSYLASYGWMARAPCSLLRVPCSPSNPQEIFGRL